MNGDTIGFWGSKFQQRAPNTIKNLDAWAMNPIFMIFDPPSSNDINPQFYITKLLITKPSRSFVDECYNEPLRKAGEHSRKLGNSSGEKRGRCERRQL